MIRTQIQLPDALHAQAKQVAERQQMSLAELVRRGLEHMVRPYRTDETQAPTWRLPDRLPLGRFLAPLDDWRALANVTTTTESGLA